jgi:hypothetical protein
MKTALQFTRCLAMLAFGLTALGSPATGSATTKGHREGIDRTNACCRPSKPEPRWHSACMLPKIHNPPIRWYDKINPVWWLGNAEEPVPPAWYEPGNPHRNTEWYFRNPLSNFTYFVIGVADKRIVRSGRYPTEVGNPHGGWNFAVTRRRILFLPFWDYKNSRMEFYFGWRERGNFGIKLVFHHTPETIKP